MYNNAAMNNSSGKRKMDQVDAAASQFNLFNLHDGGLHLFPSSSHYPPLAGLPHHTLSPSPLPPPAPPAHSSVKQILNTAAPSVRRPFSFMSLLNADDDDEEDEYHEEDPLDTEIRSQKEQVNHTLSLHNDILKRALEGMLERQHRSIHRAAEESAANRLRHREAELRMKTAHIRDMEVRAEHHKREADRLSVKLSYLEKKMRSMSSRLERAKDHARRHVEPACEEGDSSTEDQGKAVVGPVRIDCKLCNKEMATVLMWPCRHVSVCKQCDAVTNRCPVCRLAKLTSVEVFLSLKQD